MKKVQKHDRISVITNVLTNNPNKIYTLTYFCNLFDCAKSTISEDLDIDSLAAVELALELETAFDIRIEDEELANLKTVQDIMDLIGSKQ